MSGIEVLRKTLSKNNQEHLLMFYEDLNEKEKEQYVGELSQMDFKEMNIIFERAFTSYTSDVQLLDDRMKPVPKAQFEAQDNVSPEKLQHYYDTGLQAIAKGNVAVLLMAGGQGTRLGVTYPKGMFDIGLLSKKTLFQIQAERIQKIQKLANEKYNSQGSITWYIMTSGPTMTETKAFLEKNKYFGLSNVVLFEQGLLPCFDFKGRILMEAKDKISKAPDGNGGIYKALKVNGTLNDFKSRGVKYVHVHSVDNILTKVADPTFVGYCIEKNADCGAKVVQKASPSEAVGVVCMVDNKFQVVEYSEITETTANLRNSDGSLVFNAGNICNHFFTTEFLENIAVKQMILHVAKKKIPYISDDGELIRPTTANGIKIEKFVFDVFQFSDKFVTWEVPRHTEFSALKNSDDVGKDCPSTAKRDLYRLHKKYLESVNAVVIGDEVEISSSISYAGEGLESFVGQVIQTPRYVNSLN